MPALSLVVGYPDSKQYSYVLGAQLASSSRVLVPVKWQVHGYLLSLEVHADYNVSC